MQVHDEEIQQKLQNEQIKKKEVDSKQQALKEVESSHQQTQIEMNNILASKLHAVLQMKNLNKQILQEKNGIIKQLREETVSLKEQIKDARLRRKDLDDLVFKIQDDLVKKKVALKELSEKVGDINGVKDQKQNEIKELKSDIDQQQSMAQELYKDLDREKELNEKLNKKLNELEGIKDQLKQVEGKNLGPQQLEQLRENLNNIKKDIENLQNEYDKNQKDLEIKQQGLQNEIKRLSDFQKANQVNKMINYIERETKRYLLILIELETKIRKLVLTMEDRLDLIIQYIENSKVQNQELENESSNILSDLRLISSSLDQIKEEINNLVLNCSKIEDPSSFQLGEQQLKQYEKTLEDIKIKITKQENLVNQNDAKFNSFQKKAIEIWNDKINKQIKINQDVIEKIHQMKDEVGIKAKKSDDQLSQFILSHNNQIEPMIQVKTKISRFFAKYRTVESFIKNETHIINKFKNQLNIQTEYILNYLYLFNDLNDQNQRLNKTLNFDLQRDLQDLIKQIEEDLRNLEKLDIANKLQKQKDKLKEIGDYVGKVDEKIEAIQNRMSQLNDDIKKLDPNQHQSLINQALKELGQLQKELDDSSNNNKKLKDELERLKRLSPEELIKQGDLDKYKDKFEQIEFKELPPIDKGLHDLEHKIKHSLGRKKGDQRRALNDSLQKNKLNVKQLTDILDKIEKELVRLDDEHEHLSQLYKYKDLERDADVNQTIKNELQKHQKQYQALKGKRDQLNQQIQNLEDQVENISVQLPDEKQIQEWNKLINSSNNLSQEIDKQLNDTKEEQRKIAVTSDQLNEASEKYKHKDKLYRKCGESQKLKQSKIDLAKKNAQVFDKKIQALDNQLKDLVIPKDVGDHIQEEFATKKRKLNEIKQSLGFHFDNLSGVQDKLQQIVSPIKDMPTKKVSSQNLQDIIEDLNKLDVETQEFNDDFKYMQGDLDALIEDLQKFLDRSKNFQLDQAEKDWNVLQKKMAELDEKFGDCEGKHQHYTQKIKEGQRTFSDEDDILDELKDLKGQSDEIEKLLRQIDNQRLNLHSKDRQAKDLLLKMKANKKNPPTIDEIQNLTDKFKQYAQESVSLYDDLNKMEDDLDDRIAYLDQFLKRGNELRDKFKDYQKLTNGIQKNLQKQNQEMQEAIKLSDLLRQVLEQMEFGIEKDYLGKDEFIRERQVELQEQEALIKDLMKNQEQLQNTYDNLKTTNIRSLVDCDINDLNEQMPHYFDLADDLNEQEQRIYQVFQVFHQIRTDIGIADVPKNIRQREQELLNFTQKLKQYETDFVDIKKLSQQNSLQNYSADLRLIDKYIKELRDNKVKYSRVLRQELSIYESQPSKIDSLVTLRDLIQKIRELYEKMRDDMDLLAQQLMDTNRLKKQIGSQDQLNKWKNLEIKEDDLRQRMLSLKKRFKIIQKGGDDCDGYTSNSEEATFIDTLLYEMPEVHNKSNKLMEVVDDIQSQIIAAQRELDQIEGDDNYMQLSKELGGKLVQIDETVNIAEKDVIFLEKLADSLEDKFIAMEVQRKLDKRGVELSDIQQINKLFEQKTKSIEDQVRNDLLNIENQAQYLESIGEDPAKDRDRDDLAEVQEELKDYLSRCQKIFQDLYEYEDKRKMALNFYNERIVSESPYKKYKNLKKYDHFLCLDLNSQIKKKILEIIKELKGIEYVQREIKKQYNQLRANYADLLSRKLYNAIKGDLVDEQIGEYINKLNYEVPLERLGNNQYNIAGRKIIAQLINEKLMVRVGGGYVGMDEFMMVYGASELMKVQREENKKGAQDFDFVKTELVAQYFISDFIGEDMFEAEPTTVELENLKERMKTDYETRKQRLFKNHSIGERTSSEGKKPVVGILEARQALKKNINHMTGLGGGNDSNTKSMSNINSNKSPNKSKPVSQSSFANLKSINQSKVSDDSKRISSKNYNTANPTQSPPRTTKLSLGGSSTKNLMVTQSPSVATKKLTAFSKQPSKASLTQKTK